MTAHVAAQVAAGFQQYRATEAVLAVVKDGPYNRRNGNERKRSYRNSSISAFKW